MDAKTELERIRERIEEIDRRLLPLFEERMRVAGQAAEIKRENGLPVPDSSHEQRVIDRVAASVTKELRGEVSLLLRSVTALSHIRQRQLPSSGETPLFPASRTPKHSGLICAYQGVPGAWSEQTLLKLFPDAKLIATEYFEDVFTAVKEKRADYGAVPIENSQTGAIGETYDLLGKHGCFIAGRTWMNIGQCLLAPKGTRLSDIREVYSHPEGLKQCARFLKQHPWELKASRNTAVAAQTAALSSGGKTAAIGSRRAAELNSLEVLEADITDTAGNRTSFVIIAGEPEYDEQSDVISVIFSTLHRSGALCEALLPFMARELNLLHIESRPAGEGKYRFFADLQGNILDAGTVLALRQAATASEYFKVLGCYSSL